MTTSSTIRRVLAAAMAVAAMAPAAKCGGDAAASSASCRTGLTAEQADNARAVVRVADEMGLPERAKVVAIATALQESDLDAGRVGDGGAAVGVFQQHPHWGRNRVDPASSARRFYASLVKVRGWQSRPLTEAAQAVQRSAHPGAYAKHEGRAARIVARLSACGEGARPVSVRHLATPAAVTLGEVSRVGCRGVESCRSRRTPRIKINGRANAWAHAHARACMREDSVAPVTLSNIRKVTIMARATPRQNRLAANISTIQAATAIGDWRRAYVTASQWVMAELKSVEEIDPGKAAEVYEALAQPLIDAATRLNQKTWRINA